MSLVGNLEDLGLGDILQIVSLSRKSGVLRLKHEGRGGAIVFRNGEVVCAAIEGGTSAQLADDLATQGALSPEERDDVLQLWRDSGQRHSLAGLIEHRAGVDRERIQAVIRARVEDVVYTLFHWSEGTFDFELKEVQEELENLSPEVAQFVLDVGLSPQYLAMEGTRVLDESRAIGGAVRPSGEEEGVHDGRAGRDEAGGASGAPAMELAEPPCEVGQSDVLGAIRTPDEAPAGAAAVGVLLIDDDALTLSQIQEKLSERGFEVTAASGTRQGLEQVGALEAAGAPFFVVADLLMPRSDDAGILGGIEILDRVRSGGAPARVVLVTDYENEEARKKAMTMGCDAFLRKPRKAQLNREADAPELLNFIDELTPLLATWAIEERPPEEAAATSAQEEEDRAQAEPAGEGSGEVPATPPDEAEPAAPVSGSGAQGRGESEAPEPAAQEPPGSPESGAPEAPARGAQVPKGVGVAAPGRPQNGAGMVNIREELAKEFGEDFFSEPPGGRAEPIVASRGLAILKAMTDELNDPNSNVEITLLVLRFAAELMGRAVIFVVTPKDVRGLGEFGVEIEGDNGTRRVRRMRVPLDEPSVLQRVIERHTVVKAPLSEDAWDRYLVEQLGGMEPREAFVAPIYSAGRIVAVLYADNVPEQMEIGDTESLEIFLMQAGMAMDRALLSRQLKESSRGAK